MTQKNKILSSSKKIVTSALAVALLSTSLYAQRDDDRQKSRKSVQQTQRSVQPSQQRSRQSYQKDVRPSRPSSITSQPKYNSGVKYVRPPVKVIPKHTYNPPRVVTSHHYYRPGHRVNHLHRDAFTFMLGGLTYYYLSGMYYRPYDTGYVVVSAPLGAVVYSLPSGYTRIMIGSVPYYRYYDTFYRWDNRRSGYIVVDAPVGYAAQPVGSVTTVYQYQVGDIALNLPAGTVQVIIDGRHYYEAEGVYFEPTRYNGKNAYRVINPY